MTIYLYVHIHNIYVNYILYNTCTHINNKIKLVNKNMIVNNPINLFGLSKIMYKYVGYTHTFNKYNNT